MTSLSNRCISCNSCFLLNRFNILHAAYIFSIDTALEKGKMGNVKASKKEAAGQRYAKHVRISPTTHKALSKAAIDRNRTIESLADELLASALKRERAA